jgi:hypothetical protein
VTLANDNYAQTLLYFFLLMLYRVSPCKIFLLCAVVFTHFFIHIFLEVLPPHPVHWEPRQVTLSFFLITLKMIFYLCNTILLIYKDWIRYLYYMYIVMDVFTIDQEVYLLHCKWSIFFIVNGIFSSSSMVYLLHCKWSIFFIVNGLSSSS